MKRRSRCAVLVALAASCGGDPDPIVGEWVSAVGTTDTWTFEADGAYRTNVRVDTEGTWSRIDDHQLQLFRLDETYPYPEKVLDVAQDRDILLAGHLFTGPVGPLAGTTWNNTQTDCCQNGSPFEVDSRVDLRTNGTVVYYISRALAGETAAVGTWTETTLGFDVMIDDPTGYAPDHGRFGRLGDRASPDTFTRR